MKYQAETLTDLEAAARRVTILSVLGVLIVVFSIGYAVIQLDRLESTLVEKRADVSELETQLNSMRETVQELEVTQNDILDFLSKVTSGENVQLLDPAIDWEKTKATIIELPPGNRKQAIFVAILLAWKDIPFELSEQSLSAGFDSPRFLRYVLSQVGITISDKPGVPLSANMMQHFERVDNPKPGDLMFYRGQIGSFGFIYLSEGSPEGQGVGVGTLQKVSPLMILDTSNVNTPFFPFIGYFRVIYPDEIETD